MFFLSISAHLFIYLLVPAFLIVCFHFGGTVGGSELSSLAPSTIAYEHVIPVSSGKTYVYCVEKQQEAGLEEEFAFPELPAVSPGFHDLSPAYLMPSLEGKCLRAPPFAVV